MHNPGKYAPLPGPLSVYLPGDLPAPTHTYVTATPSAVSQVLGQMETRHAPLMPYKELPWLGDPDKRN